MYVKQIYHVRYHVPKSSTPNLLYYSTLNGNGVNRNGTYEHGMRWTVLLHKIEAS